MENRDEERKRIRDETGKDFNIFVRRGFVSDCILSIYLPYLRCILDPFSTSQKRKSAMGMGQDGMGCSKPGRGTIQSAADLAGTQR